MEIEKKFLLITVPENLGQYEKKEIEQGYLNRKPTVRIRKSNEDYILTYKGKVAKHEDSDSTICSNEIEAELTEAAYAHLKEKIDGYIISKTRYIIPIGTVRENCPGLAAGPAEEAEQGCEGTAGPDASAAQELETRLKIELDVFHGRLEGLVYAEVEFPSLAAAESFKKPEWFGRDVSADSRYRNGYLSQLERLEDM